MDLSVLRKQAILGLKTLSLEELKEKRERLEEEKKKMLAEKAIALGTSEPGDVAATCSSERILCGTISRIGDEIEKLVGTQACLDFSLAEDSHAIGLWSLVQVEYEDPNAAELVEKLYLISPIMPGAVAFKDGDVIVHVVTPESQIGRQLVGEGVDAQITCNMSKKPHIGTIIGFA